MHPLGTPFVLSPQPPPAYHGGYLKQQKLYCNYTNKPQNTLQSGRGVRGDKEAQRGAMGKYLLAEAGTAARWLQAAVPLQAAAQAPRSHCCPIPQLREEVLCSHGQGASGSWPKGCHGGEGEAHRKLATSLGGTQASATGTTSAAMLRSSGEGVPPMGIRVWRARGQSREMVRSQPRLQHQCFPHPAPTMPWATRTCGPAQRLEQLSSMMLKSFAP